MLVKKAAQLVCLFLLVAVSAFGQTKINANNQIKGLTLTKSIDIFTPTTADTNKIQFYWPAAVTLQRVACSVDTGTATIQFDERAEATPNTAGTDALTSALACDTDSQVTTDFWDANYREDSC